MLPEFQAVLRASCEMMSGCALYAVYLQRKPFVATMQRHLDKIVLLFLVSFVAVLLVSVPVKGPIVDGLLILASPLLPSWPDRRALADCQTIGNPAVSVDGEDFLFAVCDPCSGSDIAERSFVARTVCRLDALSSVYAVLAFYALVTLSAAVALYKLVEVRVQRPSIDILPDGLEFPWEDHARSTTTTVPTLTAPSVMRSEGS